MTAVGTTGLSTDGVLVYGSEFAFGCGNFEGRWACRPADRSLVFANDCHGDTYVMLPVNGALYSTGHSHDCTPIGSSTTTSRSASNGTTSSPRPTFVMVFNTGPDTYGWDYNGVPASTVLDWFPNLTEANPTTNGMPAGTVAVSGFSQTAWSLATNAAGTYLVVGGEFPAAGFQPQQGLTRFAVPQIQRERPGVRRGRLPPTVTPLAAPGAVRVGWTASWDRDNENLTYEIFCDAARPRSPAKSCRRRSGSETPTAR